MRRFVVMITVIAVLAGTVATTTASARLSGGIGDQNSSTFGDGQFKALKVKRTRYIVAWDALAARLGLDHLGHEDRGVVIAPLRLVGASQPDVRRRRQLARGDGVLQRGDSFRVLALVVQLEAHVGGDIGRQRI